jgi:hypothetical protein
MRKVAILACAGWKGVGRGTEFVHLPAPFLPLGDGTTCASRLSVQFQALGYEVALTAGPLGYPFKAYQPRHVFRTSKEYAGRSGEDIARVIGVDPEDSPCTEALHDDIRKLGHLVITKSPGWTSKHDSFCEVLDRIGGEYERAVLTEGDTLYAMSFLKEVLETMPWPSQFALCPLHGLFMLDRVGMAIYRHDAEEHRDRPETSRNWGLRVSRYPDGGEGAGRLIRCGIAHYGWHTPPWDRVSQDPLWVDIDHPGGYTKAKRRIAEGWYA